METDEKNTVRRISDLSQSYTECVERVAQRKNDGGLNFSLPDEVLEERQKVWDDFFLKYADDASDIDEVDMNTLEPVIPADEHLDDNKDDGNKGDEGDQYYSKCRASLRKLPHLIQYWIDTGNPPYQLVINDDNSETGSSLSEGSHLKLGCSDVPQDCSQKRKSTTSRCSSVDTAAYILSNTNVTKKTETMAIIEGAKNSTEESFNKNVLALREKAGSPVEMTNHVIKSPNRNETSLHEICQAATPKASEMDSELTKSRITTPLQASQPSASFKSMANLLEVSSPQPQSVKLSEILPELQEFDEMLKRSNAVNVPKTRSSVPKICQNPRCISPVTAVTQSSQDSSIFVSSRNKSQHRKRLYTNTDSPVDLSNQRTKGDMVQTLVRNSVHPALEIGTARVDRVKRLAARIRARKKRKRSLRISQINSDDTNTSQESDRQIGEENSKGDGRYTDFFESLGLTPSRMVYGKPRAKRSGDITRPKLPRKAKDVAPGNNSIESSSRESANRSPFDDSVFSPEEGKDRNWDDKQIENAPGNNIPMVRIERLSERCLARYSRKTAGISRNKRFPDGNKSRMSATPSTNSVDNEKKSLEFEKVELLTNMTQDSDSSTILICLCDDSNESWSDARLPEKKLSMRTKLRSRISTNPTRTATNAVNSESARGSSSKKFTDVFVKLEKLNINDFEKSRITEKNLEIKRKEDDVEQRSPKMRFGTPISRPGQRTSLQATSLAVESEEAADFFYRDSSFAIGKQIFEQKKSTESLEKSCYKFAKTHVRRNRGIALTLDDDDDSFVKLVSELHEIGSERDPTKLGNANRERTEIMDIAETQNMNNKDAKITMEKCQKLFQISTSSDEEDVCAADAKKGRAMDLNSRNRKNGRVRKLTEVHLLRELPNGEKVITPNNQLDKSLRRKLTRRKTRKPNGEINIKVGETRVTRGRRKTRNNVLYSVVDESTVANLSSEAQRCYDGEGSTQHELFASRRSQNQISERNSFQKSEFTSNMFKRLHELSSTNVEGVTGWGNYNSDVEYKDSSSRKLLTIADTQVKSKNLTTTRTASDCNKMVRFSFRTCQNFDSDATSESVRSSRNYNNIQRDSKNRSSEIFHGSHPEIEKTDTIPYAQRRTLENSLDEDRQTGEKYFNKRERGLVNGKTKSPENCVHSHANEITNDDTSRNVGSSLTNVSPTKEAQDSLMKRRTIKPRVVSSTHLTSFDRSKDHSLVDNQRNGQSPRRSVVSKKKKRKMGETRILGNSREWQSDDDTDTNGDVMKSKIAKQAERLDAPTNGNASSQLNDKDSSDDRDPTRIRRSPTKSLFSRSSDDTVNFNLLFVAGEQSTDADTVLAIDELNFVSTREDNIFGNSGTPSMKFGTRFKSFRTRIRSDTDSEGES